MGSKAHHDPDDKLIKRDGKTITFPPLALGIVWGNDPRYWRLPKIDSNDNKNDDQPAELIQVCWLEVTGVVEVEKGKSYKVSFDLALKSDAFGWNGCQVYIMAKVGKKGKYNWKKISLNQDPNKRTYPLDNDMVVEVDSNEGDPKVYFGLYEVWSGKWKGGLQLHNATLTQVN